MKAFQFIRPKTVEDAALAMQKEEGKAYKGGGIDLLDLMKERVAEPGTVVGLFDIEGLDTIAVHDDGSIHIGAAATLTDLVESDVVRRYLPSLAEAAGQAASLQIRNRATVAGNIAQKTRCGYYRHASFPCLLRGGDVCPVRNEGGVQDTAGIFYNQTCASAHPSSLAPVFGSLDAIVHHRIDAAMMSNPFHEIYSPAGHPRPLNYHLRPGQLIERIEIPPRDVPQKLGYAEIRQKAAFDWALASCAVRVVVEGGKVAEARVWLGSLAPIPLRATWVEQLLVGKAWNEDVAAKAGDVATQGATPLPGTRYKVQLARVAVKRALLNAMGR